MLLQEDAGGWAGNAQVARKLCGHLFGLQDVAVVAELQHHGLLPAPAKAAQQGEKDLGCCRSPAKSLKLLAG